MVASIVCFSLIPIQSRVGKWSRVHVDMAFGIVFAHPTRPNAIALPDRMRSHYPTECDRTCRVGK
ncbi:hypothetical protein [Moorena producens]|uniref:hypothetical protein n=1 Tax=Moorena producens TaxID=1155739 RepID=UPI003C77218F